MTVSINDRPVTIADVTRGLEALLNQPVTTNSNGSVIEENDHNGRANGAKLASLLISESPAQAEPAYPLNEKLLGKEVAAAVQFFPKAIIERLEREVKQRHINPQKIIEFKVDLDRHVEVNTGELRLTLLGDYNDKRDDELKITKEHLERIRDNTTYDPASGRGGLKNEPRDLSRFSIDEPSNVITIRVGKIATSPLPDEIRDIVEDAVNNNKKVLFLGQTGVGKTTLIRQISTFLSDQGIGASIFDKSKEIGGPGLTPNPEAIGFRARRFVPKPLQDIAEALIRMLENHNPKVLMVDELSNRNQFEAVARMIKEKGVPTAFIFTHGTTLAMAMNSENAKELLAKVDNVTVSDYTAGNVQDKIRPNVVGRPLADVVVEMVAPGVYVVHRDVLDSMKKLAAGEDPEVEVYPQETDISKYRSKEAEQFMPKKMSNPLERGTNSKPSSAVNISALGSREVVDKAYEFENPNSGLGQERKRKPSHVSKTDIKNMSNQRLKRLHDEIARIPEANRNAKQGNLFPRLAAEIERRGIQQQQ
jgi:hypothetical protein